MAQRAHRQAVARAMRALQDIKRELADRAVQAGRSTSRSARRRRV
jgi:hypothetical protein